MYYSTIPAFNKFITSKILINYKLFYSNTIVFSNLKIKIFKTITIPIVLYGCETWSLTLREERIWKYDPEANTWAQDG